MVSKSKRMVNVTDESSSESDFEVPESSIAFEKQLDNCNNRRSNTRARIPGKEDSSISVDRSTRKPKCFSRNALLARENRIKKKIYVSNLESELSTLKEKNKLLSKMFNNQVLLTEDLKKELKYLKSALANSTDLSKLLNIRQSTGMSVTSSVFDSTLSLNNCISKLPHPFDQYEQHSETPLPPSEMAWSSSLLDDAPNDFGNVLINDVSLGAPFSFGLSDQMNDASPPPSDHWSSSTEIPEEHNYTLDCREIEDDTGICLHVSKHRVSLEFCPSCSDNARQAWSK